jgi:hypothetical protein
MRPPESSGVWCIMPDVRWTLRSGDITGHFGRTGSDGGQSQWHCLFRPLRFLFRTHQCTVRSTSRTIPLIESSESFETLGINNFPNGINLATA